MSSQFRRAWYHSYTTFSVDHEDSRCHLAAAGHSVSLVQTRKSAIHWRPELLSDLILSDAAKAKIALQPHQPVCHAEICFELVCSCRIKSKIEEPLNWLNNLMFVTHPSGWISYSIWESPLLNHHLRWQTDTNQRLDQLSWAGQAVLAKQIEGQVYSEAPWTTGRAKPPTNIDIYCLSHQTLYSIPNDLRFASKKHVFERTKQGCFCCRP